MSRLTRREFVKASLATAAGFGITSALPMGCSKVIGANDQVRVAIIGVGRQGRGYVNLFHKIPGVKVAAICDVDKSHLNRAVKILTDQGEKPDSYSDIRKVLDRKDIDAIIVVTPNHWHALATVWGCQAGKDVYVEKPVSHEIWEGQQMIAAAKKYNRIVQAGIQSRSDNALEAAFKWIQEGNLGKIKVARGFCYKPRKSIGKVSSPTPTPGVNYNIWLGPAPKKPLMRKELHYDWHWQWDTGNGDAEYSYRDF